MAKLQQRQLTQTIPTVPEAVGEVVQWLLDHGVFRNKTVLMDAFDSASNFRRIEGPNGASFGPKITRDMLDYVVDKQAREQFRGRLWSAHLRRKASRAEPSVEAFTPIEAAREFRATASRLGTGHWESLAFQLMSAAGIDPHFPKWHSLQVLIDRLVNDVRIHVGERDAYRNAIVLCCFYMRNAGLQRVDERIAALNLIFIVVDLAAQVNDARSLHAVLKLMERQLKDRLRHSTEKALYGRIYYDCLSRAFRYDRRFKPTARNCDRAATLVRQSILHLSDGLAEAGIADTWPRLYLGWANACFNLISTGFLTRSTKGQIGVLFEEHDRRISAGKCTTPGMLAEVLRVGVAPDPYVADLLADYALTPNVRTTHQYPRHGRDGVDADAAIDQVTSALARADPSQRHADTVVAHLHLTHATAILRKCNGSPTTKLSDLKERYLAERAKAANIFVPLKMARKLARLKSEEAAAGFRPGEIPPLQP